MLDQYVTRLAGPSSILGNLVTINIFMAPVVLGLAFFIPHPFNMQPASLLWVILGAPCVIGGLLPYLIALKTDEVHNVVPLMEFVPVFVSGLAYVFFGDALTGWQLIGGALVVAGGFLFMWDFQHSRIRFKTLGLMILASLGFALYQLILRKVSATESPWQVTLAATTAYFLCSFCLFIFVPTARRSFIGSLKYSHGKVAVVGFIQNVIDCGATCCIIIAFAYAPGAGYVASLSGTQSFFILLFSVALGFIWPQEYPRIAWDKAAKWKLLFLALIVSGIVLLGS